MRKFIIVALFGMFACTHTFYSCTQVKYIPTVEYKTKDSVITKEIHDSIKIKVKEYIKGDTVYRDSIVHHFISDNSNALVSIVDSIPYPVEVTKEVERQLNSYEKTMIRLGWLFLVILLAFLLHKGIKLYKAIKMP